MIDQVRIVVRDNGQLISSESIECVCMCVTFFGNDLYLLFTSSLKGLLGKSLQTNIAKLRHHILRPYQLEFEQHINHGNNKEFVIYSMAEAQIVMEAG
jgi:hypothetical protein